MPVLPASSAHREPAVQYPACFQAFCHDRTLSQPIAAAKIEMQPPQAKPKERAGRLGLVSRLWRIHGNTPKSADDAAPHFSLRAPALFVVLSSTVRVSSFLCWQLFPPFPMIAPAAAPFDFPALACFYRRSFLHYFRVDVFPSTKKATARDVSLAASRRQKDQKRTVHGV